MRLLGRRQQRDLADIHPVHRHHMAAHEPVPSSIPIQPQVRSRQDYFYKYSTTSKNSQARVSKYYSVRFIRYLLTIHDHVYSCQYGTFIGNDIFGD